MIATFLLGHWRAVVALVVVAVLATYIETLRIERDVAYAAEATAKAALTTFKAEVSALGEKAENARIAKEAADKSRKEAARAENSAALATLAGDIGRLRAERDSARLSILPPGPASPGGADIACFDRPAIERAYGGLVTGLRGLGDEGAKATVDLNTAKRWAAER